MIRKLRWRLNPLVEVFDKNHKVDFKQDPKKFYVVYKPWNKLLIHFFKITWPIKVTSKILQLYLTIRNSSTTRETKHILDC